MNRYNNIYSNSEKNISVYSISESDRKIQAIMDKVLARTDSSLATQGKCVVFIITMTHCKMSQNTVSMKYCIITFYVMLCQNIQCRVNVTPQSAKSQSTVT